MINPTLGFIGLGRMGLPMCSLIAKHHKVVAYDNVPEICQQGTTFGLNVAKSLQSLIEEITRLQKPRIIWLMVPAVNVNVLITKLLPSLESGDIIIDGGNSSFSDSKQQEQKLGNAGIHFVTIGCSGGLKGAANGPPMTVSCKFPVLKKIEPILASLGNNYTHFEGCGFGHLAKGIHNAIEYGMMESIAEGVELYFRYGFTQDEIINTFKVWAKGSIIESALINCVIECLEHNNFSHKKYIKQSETVKLLEEICNNSIDTPTIDSAIKVRKNPASISDKTRTTLALLRKTFGGHAISDK